MSGKGASLIFSRFMDLFTFLHFTFIPKVTLNTSCAHKRSMILTS